MKVVRNDVCLQVLCLCPIIELFLLLAIFIIHIQKFEMRTITIQSLKLCHHLHPRRCLACRHPRHKSQLGTRNTRTQRRCCRFWIRTWTIRITRTWVIVTQVSPHLSSADLLNYFFNIAANNTSGLLQQPHNPFHLNQGNTSYEYLKW